MGGDAERAELEKWLTGWTQAASPTATLDAATQGDLRFRRGAELLRLDRTVDARREFLALIVAKKEDPRALYALALYLRDNNLYSLSMDCAERIARLAASAGAPTAPRLLWMLRYPTYYADLVVAEAKTNQVDPLLYFALIRQESTFNPWALSSSEARGLGQIVPATGREIAQRLGHKNFSLDQLYLPYISIRFGVWYFAQDMKMFNDPSYALMAYNAGAGRAKQWQRTDLDFAVEEITASETNIYVRVVYGNWRQYQMLYRGN
jgi:soluble lytic murein transglycosylase